MNEILNTPARTPEIIGAEIRALTASMLSNVIEIGRRMVEAKELLPHGSFGEWIKENTGYGLSSANNFMKIFREYGGQTSLFGTEANSQTLGKLSYTKALALLAVPAEEREEFALQVDAEHISSRELEQAIKERDEARKALQISEARLSDTRRTLSETDMQVTELRARLQQARNDLKTADQQASEKERELKERITELESRPVDVAVAEPDPEEIKSKAAELAETMRADDKAEADKAKAEAEAAKSEAEAQIKKLKEKAKAEKEKLEARLKAAEERAETAGAGDRAEAEKARAEAEELRKKLAMSGEEITVFKLRFTAWQEAYRTMQAALEKLPEEQREKCSAAVKKQAEAWT